MKTYEKMAEDVLRRVHAYEAEKKEKRARLTKAAMTLPPVCAAAAIGVVLWQTGAFAPNHNMLISQNPDSAGSAVVTELTVDQAQTTANAPESEAFATVQTTAATLKTEPTATVQTTANTPESESFIPMQTTVTTLKSEPFVPMQTTVTTLKSEPSVPTTTTTFFRIGQTGITPETRPLIQKVIGNGRCLTAGEDGSGLPENYVRLITSYPVEAEPSYAIPDAAGEWGSTLALRSAMEEYGDTARYYVIVDLFNERSEPVTDHDTLYREFERLAEAVKPSGSNAIFSTSTSPEETTDTILLNATYDQLQDFPAGSEYKYFLRLYGGATAEQEPVFFNAEN